MYCRYCGAMLHEPYTVCYACGRPVAEASVSSGTSRVAGHVRLLAIFWFIVAALWLLPAIVLFSIGTATGIVLRFPGGDLARFGGAVLFYTLGSFFLAIGAASFAAAWGLLRLRPWARPLVIVLGCISLLHWPFGTALGIYTLWVLLPVHAADDYERMAGRPGPKNSNEFSS